MEIGNRSSDIGLGNFHKELNVTWSLLKDLGGVGKKCITRFAGTKSQAQQFLEDLEGAPTQPEK